MIITPMSFVDLCSYLYPGQYQLGNIEFGMKPGGVPFITKWTVPNIEQPTTEYLQSQIPVYQHLFDVDTFKITGGYLLSKYIDEVAAQRKYDSALSCVSYISSANQAWKLEAITFIAWRDAVFLYTIDQITLMESDSRSVPTFDEFKTELPTIVWP